MNCYPSKILMWIKIVSQYKDVQKNESIELSIIKDNSINKKMLRNGQQYIN